MYKPVLVLNASYEPIRITAARYALKLIVKGAAVIEADHDRECYPGMLLPSVVRLSKYCRVPHIAVMPHNRNVYLRDGHCCQYCGRRFSAGLLTVDHVVPKSQGGMTVWENLVAACKPCNQRKANKTPEQAEMPLLSKPRQRTIHTSKYMMRIMGADDPKWREYLYY
jgi:hypothetical protein